MRLPIVTCLLLGIIATAAWGAPALQQLAATDGMEVVLSAVGSQAQVRQAISVPLRPGANRLTFTWAAEKIDAASVRLHAGPELIVGETTRPAGASKALAWDVTAPAQGEFSVTVSYLLSELKWAPSYRLTYQPGDGKATLSGELTVTNGSGLPLEGATLSLALGRATADQPADQIIFELPDVGDLSPGSAARAQFLPPMALPARLVHRIDGERDARKVRQVLTVQPPADGALAREALPVGPASVVLLTQMGLPARSLAGEIRYVPGEEFELDLGVERDIVVERVMLEQVKQNLDFDRLGRVAGFDTVERFELRVRNHRSADVQLEIIEPVLETWDFSSRELFALDRDEGECLMRLVAPAGDELSLRWTLIKHSGTRIPKKN